MLYTNVLTYDAYVLLWLDACWFRFDTYSASEDESVVWVEILLSSPAADDLPIQIGTTDDTATGEFCAIVIDSIPLPVSITFTEKFVFWEWHIHSV